MMLQRLHLTSVGLSLLKGSLFLAKVAGLAVLVLLWWAFGAFLGMALLVEHVMALPAEARDLYQLAMITGLLAFGAHAMAGFWPFTLLMRKG